MPLLSERMVIISYHGGFVKPHLRFHQHVAFVPPSPKAMTAQTSE